MQDLYFFFEKSECKTRTPCKIGSCYLNQFAINEDAAFEIESVYFLQESNAKMAEVWNEPEYKTHKRDIRRKYEFDFETLSSCFHKISNSRDKSNEEREIHIIFVIPFYQFREGFNSK